MTRVLLASLLLSLPSALTAQSPMSAEEFDAYTQGQTFYYAENGTAYGGEEYLRNRRVRWSFLGDECKDGYWYPHDGLICFVYEDFNGPQCWSFTATGDGLRATFHGEGATTELYEVRKTDEPLLCLGPEVGV